MCATSTQTLSEINGEDQKGPPVASLKQTELVKAVTLHLFHYFHQKWRKTDKTDLNTQLTRVDAMW